MAPSGRARPNARARDTARGGGGGNTASPASPRSRRVALCTAAGSLPARTTIDFPAHSRVPFPVRPSRRAHVILLPSSPPPSLFSSSAVACALLRYRCLGCPRRDGVAGRAIQTRTVPDRELPSYERARVANGPGADPGCRGGHRGKTVFRFARRLVIREVTWGGKKITTTSTSYRRPSFPFISLSYSEALARHRCKGARTGCLTRGHSPAANTRLLVTNSVTRVEDLFALVTVLGVVQIQKRFFF